LETLLSLGKWRWTFDAGFDSILPASNDQKKVEKLQEELKGAKAPGAKVKKQQIKQMKLYKTA
jgi:hypothetical protein